MKGQRALMKLMSITLSTYTYCSARSWYDKHVCCICVMLHDEFMMNNYYMEEHLEIYIRCN